MVRYKTLLNRASNVTFGKKYDELKTIEEKQYIKVGVDRMLDNDTSRGGYGGDYKKYILEGGHLPAREKRLPSGHIMFSVADLGVIKRNTNRNAHLQNYLFIAKKTGFPTIRIKRIIEMSENKGYNVEPQASQEYYDDLMTYLRNKLSQREFQAVYSRL